MINTVFKALSDPTRRAILDLLKDKDMNAGEIADHFRISKPSISQHLTLLKQADLVTSVRDGQHIVYSLNLTVFNELLKWIIGFQSGKGSGSE